MGGTPEQPDQFSSSNRLQDQEQNTKTKKPDGNTAGTQNDIDRMIDSASQRGDGFSEVGGGEEEHVLESVMEDDVPMERIASLPQGSATPGEMTFACALHQNGRYRYLDAVLDTGCGPGYLVGGSCGMEVIPACYRVEMADGSTVSITEMVETDLVVGTRVENVRMKVLPNSSVKEPYILFGRELIARFNIQTDGCKVNMGHEVLHDAVNFVTEVEQQLVELPRVEDVDSERVNLPIGPEGKEAVENAIKGLLNLNKELDFCEGAMMRLRELSSEELRDTPGQQYTFELTLPLASKPVSATAANRLYSAAVYRKLSPAARTEFDELVQGYVQRGWWKPADFELCATKCGYAANVFPVVAAGKKTRLVSDFRMLNQFYPSSTKTPRIHHPLMLLRCLPAEHLVIADCRSAFYRVRLSEPVWLNVGGRDFLCQRLAFGLSMGPEGLRGSLGALWSAWKKDIAKGPGYGALFVDDFFVTAKADVAPFFHLLDRCGFEIPVEKFQNDLTESKLLGVTLERRGSTVGLRCERLPLVELVKQVQTNATKKLIFTLAGIIGYDPAHLHPERRLIADLLRSIVGKYQVAWTQVLELQECDQMVVDDLLKWLLSLNDSDCNHKTTPGKNLHLRLETDASKFGMGFVLKHRNAPNMPWVDIYSDASAWKRVQRNYHVNRLESFALLLGLRVVTMFLEFIRDSCLGPEGPVVLVEVYSDSTTALAWARTGEPQVNYKSIEMRQIQSLAESLHCELKLLRKLAGEVTISHIPGTANSEGDRLSRLLYRDLKGTCLGDRVHQGKLPRDSVVQMVTEESKPTLVRSIAEDCRTLTDLLLSLRQAAKAFMCWGGRARIELTASEGGSSEVDVFAPHVIGILGRAAQVVSSPKDKNQYICVEDVYYLEQSLFTGDIIRRVVIPNHIELIRVRELIVRHFHEKNHHRGSRFDAGSLAMSVFKLEGVHSVVKSVIAKCLLCARKNAILRKGMAAAVQTVKREVCLPPFSRVSFDFVQFGTTNVLSALCIDTSVLFLSVVPNASADGAIYALTRMARLYCVEIRRLLSDNAKALSTKFESLARKEWNGVEFFKRAPYESSQNLVERSHKDMWSVLRSRKASKLLREEVWDITDQVLEEVCYIVNRRPLGVTETGEVVTPAKLAWGSNWIGDGGNRLVKFREFFYENLFALHRRRHLPNRKMRRALVPVGDMVLYQYAVRGAKDEFEHEVGKVVAIDGNIVTVQSRKREYKVGSSSIIPLDKYFQVQVEADTG